MDVFLSIPGLGEPKERDKVRAYYVLCGVKRLNTTHGRKIQRDEAPKAKKN